MAAPPEFTVEEAEELGVVVLVLSGHLNATTAPRFEDALIGRLKNGAAAVVDMAFLRYISSEGVGVLIQAAKVQDSGGGRVALCALPPFVETLLTLSGLDEDLEIHATRTAAATALAP